MCEGYGKSTKNKLAANKHAVQESSMACQARWCMSVNPSTQKSEVEDLKFDASLDYTLSYKLTHSLSIHLLMRSHSHHEPSVSQELFLDAFLVALSTVAQGWA